MNEAETVIPNTFALAKEENYNIDIRTEDCNVLYKYNIVISKNYSEYTATISTYPGFCGGAMMYYIPYGISDKKVYNLLVAACKEFFKSKLRNRYYMHVVVAYATDEDMRGQEQFLLDCGFEVVQEFVSTKTSHMIKRFELILASQEEIDMSVASRFRRQKDERAYSV